MLRTNSGLSDLTAGLFQNDAAYPQTIDTSLTLAMGSATSMVSLNRILLSEAYRSQGLVQTLCAQPIEDAFKGGINIKTTELDETEVKLWLNDFTKPRHHGRSKNLQRISANLALPSEGSVQQAVMETLIWGRLFGGAGLIINTDQDFRTQLNPEKITEDSNLEFIAADRWELILGVTNIWDERNPTPYNYYGYPLHRSRVVKVLGQRAPSWIRRRLQGWGMSVLERALRPINAFVKFENVIFELIDEAKIDIYKIQGFNDSLLTEEGTQATQKRIMLANRLKNYQNGIAMDVEDDWNQKQMTWSGLAEIWQELRTNLASALKMPQNKLFGSSATGFGGGQDALENYNATVMGIRIDAEPPVLETLDLLAQQRFGFIPTYELEWAPLENQTATEAEAVKKSKQERVMEMFRDRLVTGKEASSILRAEKLLHIDTEVSQGLRDVDPMQMETAAVEAKAAATPAKPKK